MCNKDELVSYLYDDLEGPARAAFERHLRACSDCRDELQAMRGVRADLLTWSPPEPDFAFRIVAEPRAARAQADNVLRPVVPSWRAWFKPAAAFAAAAVLVLAAAAGLARIEVHNGPDGFTMRTGWSVSAPGSARETSLAGVGGRVRDINLAASTGSPDAFSALERRISALETATRDTVNLRSASALNARASNEEILKVVRDLLAQSETRQKGELAFRIAQVIRDADMKRTADLNGVRQGIGRIDASVTEEAATHRELMNYILANSKQQK
jgi:hypothetical protein